MKYLFFDTAVNGYYTLICLKNELPVWKPLMSEQEKILDDVAPFIFKLEEDAWQIILKNDLASLKKIIFLQTNESITELQGHFQKFAVQTIKGRQFYFRFWEADVFKKFVNTCNAKQLKDFFGPVKAFVCADENGTSSLQYSFNGTKLMIEKIAAEIIATKKEIELEVISEPVKSETANVEIATPAPGKKAPRKFFY